MKKEEAECVTIKVDQPNVIQFNDLVYTIKNGSRSKTILDGACGQLISGRLTAILGPSGAGKSSLLNVLSGFKYIGVKGSILVNGRTRNIKNFQQMSSYIAQDFPVLGLLTVYETIFVTANLKLGNTVSHEGKHKIVTNTIRLLNLEKSTNTLVMNLSGGENKRLSIAVELVTNPPVMFCDEPTSGLDNVSSFQVLSYLQQLAKSGRIIVCVIHQPSSKLINLFDDVMVVAQGKTIYCGPLDDMVGYFKDGGYTCPQYYNQSDYVIDVASNDKDKGVVALATRTTAQYEKQTATEISLNESKENSRLLRGNDLFQSTNTLKSNRKFPVSGWQQYVILTKRSYRTMTREFLAVKLRLIFHLMTGFLTGSLYYNIGTDGSKTLSNVCSLFYITVLLYFGNVLPCVLTCPLETAVFIREHLNGWYSIWPYFLSKITAEFPLQIIGSTLYIIPHYFLSGQPHELNRFAMIWMISILVALTGMTMGIACGSVFPIQISVFIVAMSTAPLFLFCGFYIKLKEMPAFYRPITYISFFRYSLEGSLKAVYGYGREKLKCFEDFCYYKSPEKLLKDMEINGDDIGIDVIGLLITSLIFIILFYISLIYRIKKAR